MSRSKLTVPLGLALSLIASSTSIGQTAPSAAVVERSNREAVARGNAQGAARAEEVRARANTTDPLPLLRAAVLYETAGDIVAAKYSATEALRRGPGNAEALMLLGRLAAREQNWGEAADHYRRATQASPTLPAAQLGLGEALEKSGDRAGSDAAYASYRAAMGMPALKSQP